jgi:hypothetical protein
VAAARWSQGRWRDGVGEGEEGDVS